jgi:predicted ATPase/class 3 adenylate cyclase
MLSEDSGVLPTGTVTFLLTDVEGSTRLWAADSRAMSASLLVHDGILRESIEAAGGYVFTTAGDSFAAAFQRASDAVTAAATVQDRLLEAGWPGPALRVRIGLHLGEAEERGGDYFGTVVNTTARVEAAGHGGQVLMTEAVRLAATANGVDLGLHSLRDVDHPVHLHQLGDGSFPALRVVDTRLSNLPVRPTRLIGRDDEINRLRRMLGESRLVTVTAIGGSGKTRVAIAAGEAELADRDDGVWFVDLSTAYSGSDVASAIANAVGLQLSGGDAVGQVTGFLAKKDALVILDNCEHVVDECAEYAERFLGADGKAILLATSREALDVDGERTLRLGPLPTGAADSAGVRLFIDRATAVKPDVALTQGDLATIGSICERLDGMPLAIELAAARVPVMTVADLLVGLDDRFHLLSGGRRRQRQRTLEATLDWSYDLLDADEQQLFRSLGVFVDGFDFDAVAVVADVPHSTATVLIEALAAKSLVVRSDRGGRTRFRLLETVQAYAEDRLVDAAEAAMVRDRHLKNFHFLAMRNGRTAWGTLGVGERLRHDASNVSSAVEWAIATNNWEAAAELLTASSMIYFMDVRLPDLSTLLDRVIDGGVELDDDLSGCLQTTMIFVRVLLADWQRALAAIANMSSSTNVAHRASAWAFSAFLASYGAADKFGEYCSRAEAELALALAADDQRSKITHPAIWILSNARTCQALLQGDHALALHHAAETMAPQADNHDRIFVHIDVTLIASMCQILLGEPAAALETIAWLDNHKLPHYDGTEIRALAHIALGQLDEARRDIRAHASRGATGRLPTESADSLLLLAALARAEHDDVTACRLLMQVGRPRQHATIYYATVLAGELGITDQYARSLPDAPQPRTGRATNVSTIDATQAELARRGWD